MTQLKALDSLANEILMVRSSGCGTSRLRHQENQIILRIKKILHPTIRKMSKTKGLLEQADEVGQHAFIAIHNALKTWDGNLSSFSTHVHWQLRAEMRTLELHQFPERRKVCQKMTVQLVELNRRCGETEDGNPDELINIMNLDPEGYIEIEDSVERNLQMRNIERALAKIAYTKVSGYIGSGCSDRKAILGIMRDMQIYMQRDIIGMESELIAQYHKISRERVRQVADKISPIFTKNILDIVNHPRETTEEEQITWWLALMIYEEERGANISLVKENIKITLDEAEEILTAYHEERVTKNQQAAAEMEAQLQQIEVAEQQRLEAERLEEEAALSQAETKKIASIKALTIEPKRGNTSSDGQWGVRVGNYPTRYSTRAAAHKLVNDIPELRRYRPDLFVQPRRDTISLVFRRLSLNEAQKLCSLISSHGERCSKVRIANA